MSSSGSGTVINDGSGSDFLTGSGSVSVSTTLQSRIWILNTGSAYAQHILNDIFEMGSDFLLC
jgi:hypothetical protein